MATKSFIDLPAEICIAIYKKVFADTHMAIHVFDQDEKPRVTRIRQTIGYYPSIIHATLLETCSKVNTETFPIMAGAMRLAIASNTSSSPGKLNLEALKCLTDAPACLSRIFPFVTKLAFFNGYQKSICVGISAVPKLEQLWVVSDLDWETSTTFTKLPHLNKYILRNFGELDAYLARTFRAAIRTTSDWTGLKETVETQGRKFQVLFQTWAEF